jgi:hypothetical protein
MSGSILLSLTHCSKNKKGSDMKIAENLKLVGISVLLLGSLSACEKPGPAETAGEKMDEAIHEANEKINRAADKTAEELAERRQNGSAAMTDAEITAKVKASIFADLVFIHCKLVLKQPGQGDFNRHR